MTTPPDDPKLPTGTAGEIATIRDPRFSASARLHDGRVVVTLDGSADVNARPELGGFFKTVHREALSRAASAVVVDMRALSFMNSACLKELLVWLTALGKAPLERQYRVLFRLNHELRWQRRSIDALTCYMQNLVSVEE